MRSVLVVVPLVALAACDLVDPKPPAVRDKPAKLSFATAASGLSNTGVPITDLLGSRVSHGWAMNDSGDVVGMTWVDNGRAVGRFLWSDGGATERHGVVPAPL